MDQGKLCCNCDKEYEKIINGIQYCSDCSLRYETGRPYPQPRAITVFPTVWENITDMRSRLHSLEQLVADMSKKLDQIK